MSEETSVPSSNEGSTTEATEATTEATVVDQASGEATSETSYLDGKYKSVSDLENGYKELQKSYSQKLGKFDGAPEEYKLAEGVENSDLIGLVQEWGKENQLNNDGLNELVGKYEDYRTAQHNAQVETEMKKLGEQADRRLGNIRDFVTANLGEDALGALGGVLGSAEAVEAIEKMIGMTKAPAPANTPAAPTIDADQLKAMRFKTNERGERLMEIDPAYRQKVVQAEAAARGQDARYVVRN